MGDALKLLLLFVAATVVAGKVYRSVEKISCSEGQYSFKGTCFQCTPCGNFMYEQEKCSETSNTICGWCGKKPNLDEISDEVMASYQTKCLMSSLDFIGMTKLKDELMSGFEDEPKLKVRITSGKRVKSDGANDQDKFKIAKDALFNLDDSMEHDFLSGFEDQGDMFGEDFVSENEKNQKKVKITLGKRVSESEEQELPDPTLEEGRDSSEENRDEGKIRDENEIDVDDESKPEDDKTEEVTDIKSNEDPNFNENEIFEEDKTEVSSSENIDEYESFISDHVKAFLVKKVKQTKSELKEWETNPFLKGATIVSLKKVQDKFENFLPRVPIVRREDIKWMIGSDSSEDSNERDIKWDKWVDDEVKPIGESVEIVEAEELSQKYEAYEKLPVRGRIDVNELMERTERTFVNTDAFINPIILLVLALIIMTTVVSLLLVRIRAASKVFEGVPTDCQDYQMIVEASKHIEMLEEKEKKAARHVHVNPVFDV